MHTTSASHDQLPLHALEEIYDALALAIDRAGKEKTELFLVKLALLNANAMNDEQKFRKHMERALENL